MKKRFLSLMLTGAMVAGSLGGGSVVAEAKGKSDVTLTVAAAADWIKDRDRKLAEEFTEETGIKIDFQLNPNDQYVN